MRLTSTQLGLPLPVAPPAPVLDRRLRGATFLGLRVNRVVNPPESTGMPFWSLNPYVGCEFGCSYCYARATHRWTTERNQVPTEASPAEEFERIIYVKRNAARVLRQTLEPARVGGAAILIGTATDPYQPAERKYGVTRSVLEALADYRGLTIRITTKSPLVARDIDVLSALAGRHDLSISISLISHDPAVIRRLEPKTPLPHARLRGLRALTDAGLRAGLLIAPIVPGVTDGWGALGGLMAAGKDAGACFADGFALRLGPVARSGFLPVLDRAFPDLSSRYRRHYRTRDRAGRPYVEALAERLRTLQRIHGFPVSASATYRTPSRPPSAAATAPGPRTSRTSDTMPNLFAGPRQDSPAAPYRGAEQ